MLPEQALLVATSLRLDFALPDTEAHLNNSPTLTGVNSIPFDPTAFEVLIALREKDLSLSQFVCWWVLVLLSGRARGELGSNLPCKK